MSDWKIPDYIGKKKKDNDEWEIPDYINDYSSKKKVESGEADKELKSAGDAYSKALESYYSGLKYYDRKTIDNAPFSPGAFVGYAAGGMEKNWYDEWDADYEKRYNDSVVAYDAVEKARADYEKVYNRYKKYMDDTKGIDDFLSKQSESTKSASDFYKSAYDYYSAYKTPEHFRYKEWEIDPKTFDWKKAESEMPSKQKALSDFLDSSPTAGTGGASDSEIEEYNRLTDDIELTQRNITLAKQYQKAAEIEKDVRSRPDFDPNAHLNIDDETIVSSNPIGNLWDMATSKIKGSLRYDEFYRNLTDDEKRIYKYLLEHDPDAAKEYKSSKEEETTDRQAHYTYENLKGHPFEEVMYGTFVAGTDQWIQGLRYAWNSITDEKYIPQSSVQKANSMMVKELHDKYDNIILGHSVPELLSQLGTTTVNMTPMILTSAVMGPLVSGTKLPQNIAQGLTTVTASSVMGVGAYGQAYQEMINQGYNQDQAHLYGVLNGVLETTLQATIGNIAGKAGFAIKDIEEKALEGLGKAIGKAAAKFASHPALQSFVQGLGTTAKIGVRTLAEASGEFYEEALQDILEPWIKKAIFSGQYEEANGWEALYSGIMGALSSIALGAVPIASDEVQGYKQGKKYLASPAALSNLVSTILSTEDLAGFVSADNKAIELAKKVARGTTLYDIAQFVNHAKSFISETNALSISSYAQKLGLNPKDANALTTWLVYAASGHTLTEQQIAALNVEDHMFEATYLALVRDASTEAQRVEALREVEKSSLVRTDTGRIMDVGYEKAHKEAKTAKRDQIKQGVQDYAKMVRDKTIGAETTAPTAKDNVAKTVGITGTYSADGHTETVKFVNGGVEVDGKIVDPKTVRYANRNIADMVEALENSDLTNADRQAIFDRYDSRTSPIQYLLAMREMRNYGKIGVDYDKIQRTYFSESIDEEARRVAYGLGVAASNESARVADEAVQRKVEAARKSAEKRMETAGRVVYATNKTIERENLTETQNTALDAIDILARHMGTTWVIFDSTEHPELKANGAYRDGVFYIDLNAGIETGGIMLYTIAHELTHFMKQWSPAAYNVFKKFLLSHYSHGELRQRVNRQLDISSDKETGKPTLTYDEALDEVIAESCEEFLKDSNALEKIASLQTNDGKLYGKVRQKILDLTSRFRKAYSDVNPQSKEAKIMRTWKKDIDRLHKMWSEGVISATERFYNAGTRNTESTESLFSRLLSATTDENGNALFQYRAMEADEAQYRALLTAYQKQLGMTDDDIDNLFKTIDNVLEVVKQNTDILDFGDEEDFDLDRPFSPVKNNSDPLYKVSLDFSTLCRKRLLLQTIIETLQNRLNRVMSKEEQIVINNELRALRNKGLEIEVACALCYVEAARLKNPEQIKKFFADPAKVVKDYIANREGNTKEKIFAAEEAARKKIAKETGDDSYTVKSKTGKSFTKSLKSMPVKYAAEIRDAKKSALATYVATAEDEKHMDVARNMTVKDISAEGLENLARTDPVVYHAFVSFVSAATKSKGVESDTYYRIGDANKISDTDIENMNRENGLRTQSWSDFQVIHVLDYMASVIELSTRNAKMHGYTKFEDYVNLMGRTGVMINLSLIPKMLKDKSVVFDNVEGVDYDTMIRLRNTFPETVGNICIGITDDQIRALLDNIDIDYVIPYHKSGNSKPIREMLSIAEWVEYEKSQHEKEITLPKEKRTKMYHKTPSFSDWFDLARAKATAKKENDKPSRPDLKAKYGVMYGAYMAMQEAAEKYKAVCKERGLEPKFQQFLQEDNYWKLLIDRKMINQVTGEIIEQKAVRPIFSFKDETINGETVPGIGSILKKHIDGYPARVKAENEAIDTVIRSYLGGKMNATIEKYAKTLGSTFTQNFEILSTANVDEIVREAQLAKNPAQIKLQRAVTPEESARYMELAKDPEGNAEELQEMTDEAAKNAGYRYVRHTRRKNSAKNNDAEYYMFVEDTTSQNLEQYGKYRYVATDRNAVDVSSIEQKIRTAWVDFAIENDYPTNLTDGEIDPEDIVMSAGVWDNSEFVAYLFDRGVLDYDIKAIRTSDGLLVFDPAQIKSADPVVYDDNGNVIPLEERFNPENDDIRFQRTGRGNGYDGYSMSNNARAAYENAEMPISRWTKSDIIDAVRETNPDIADMLSKVNLKTLKAKLLRKTSWHHTGMMYNETDFYSIDDRAVEGITVEDVRKWATAKETMALGKEFRGDISYIEWEGSTKHKKANHKKLTDVNIEQRGSYYIVTDDNGEVLLRKKIGSNGTSVTNYEERARQKAILQEREATIIKESSPDAVELYEQFKREGYETSMSGNLYAFGRKPSSGYVAFGLDKFFHVGEKRLSPNGRGGYSVEIWDGNKWTSESSQFQRSPDEEDNTISEAYESAYEISTGEPLLSPREKLASVFAQLAKTDAERSLVEEYRGAIEAHEKVERRLAEVTSEIENLSKSKGNSKRIAALRSEKVKLTNNLATYDRKLTRLEDARPLRELITAEKAKSRAVVRATERAAADKRISAERTKAAEREKRIREQRDAKHARDMAEQRKKTKEAKMHGTELHHQGFKEGVEHEVEKAKKKAERRKHTVLVRDIKTIHKTMQDMLLNPRENRYVPKGMRQPLIRLLDALNIEELERLARDKRYESLYAKLDEATSPEEVQKIQHLIELVDERSRKAEAKNARVAQSIVSEELADRISRLKTSYDAVVNDDEVSGAFDEVVSAQIGMLSEIVGNTTIKALSNQQLEAIEQTLKAVYTAIRNADRIIDADIKGSIRERGQALMREIRENAPKKKHTRTFEWAINQHLRPLSFFERISGFVKDSTARKLYDMLEKGQQLELLKKMEYSEMFSDLLKKKAYKTFKDKVDIGLRDEKGEPLTITRGMMLSVYMNLLNAENTRHMIRGGMNIPDLKAYYSGNPEAYSNNKKYSGGTGERLASVARQLQQIESEMETADDILRVELEGRIEELNAEREQILAEEADIADKLRESIESELTDYERKWIKAMQNLFDETGLDMNAVNELMYGFSKTLTEHYFPINVDTSFLNTSNEQITVDRSLEHLGFTKARVNSSKPIMLEDVSAVVSRHISNVAKWIGMAIPLRNLHKILGTSMFGMDMTEAEATVAPKEAVGRALLESYGTSAVQYLKNLERDLNGGRERSTPMELLSKVRSNLAGAALMANFNVAFSQSASYAAASVIVGSKALLKGLATIGKKTPVDLIKKYTAMYWLRQQGYIDPDFGDLRNAKNRVTKKLYWLTGWIQKVDLLTVGRLWYASEYYVQDNFKDLSGDDYYVKVAEVFNRVIEETQPNYTTLQRPELLRNTNELVRSLAMFMTQRVQNLNILYDAARRYAKYRADFRAGQHEVNADDVKEARSQLVSAATSQLVSAAMLVGLKMIVRFLLRNRKDWRDDDTGEIEFDDVALSALDMMLGTLTGMVWMGSEAYEFAKSVFTGDKFYGPDANGVSQIVDLAEDISTFAKNPSVDKGRKVAFDFGTIFGVPVKNAYNIIEAALKLVGVVDEYTPTKKQTKNQMLQAQKSGDTEQIKKYKALYEENDEDYDSDLKSAMREDSKDLKIAAVALYRDKSYSVRSICNEYHVTKDLAQEAVKAEKQYLRDHIKDAAENLQKGNNDKYKTIVSDLKKRYDGILTQDDIVKMINRYGK